MTVRKTDGNWDPDKRGLYFLAGSGYTEDDLDAAGDCPTRFLLAVNDLVAVNTKPGELLGLLDERLARGFDVLLDSGVFWLTNQHAREHGVSMDDALGLHPTEIDHFDWLLESYVDICRRYKDRLWGYTEIDQGGAVVKRETRTMLNGLGLNPMPVYHPLNDGWNYFDELASTHDRFAFGNVVQASRKVRARLLATGWERHRNYPDLFIHWLGMTPCDLTVAFPVDSCDSSSWLGVARWGIPASATSMTHSKFHTPPEAIYRRGDAESQRNVVKSLLVEQQARQRIMDHWSQRLTDELGWQRCPTGSGL
jgi:hypothetical protein